jgi:hypothetical protein
MGSQVLAQRALSPANRWAILVTLVSQRDGQLA